MQRTRFTAEGFEELKKEQEEILRKRPITVDELQRARELGDLSENGFYKAARAKLSSIDARLRRLSFLLNTALIVPKGSTQTIGIGSTVMITNNNKKITYRIVGDIEADPTNGKISLLSPLGRALAGKKVGDKVTVQTPKDLITYQILKIS